MKKGHYELKHSSSRVLAWSHGSRLRKAVRIISDSNVSRLLDYGCGDGALERLLAGESKWRGTVVAADIALEQVRDCQLRLQALPRTSFATIEDLREGEAFEGIVCLEVLEHVVDVDQVIEHFASLLTDGGLLVVSVPVETGAILLAKQFVRFKVGGDYRFTEQYSLSELIRALIPTSKRHERPVYYVNPTLPHHGHKLFNWRWLRTRLSRYFVIERELCSPMPFLCSQKWFVCRKRQIVSRAHQL